MPKLKSQKSWFKKKTDRLTKYFSNPNVGAGISRDLIIEPSLDNNINYDPSYESDSEELNVGQVFLEILLSNLRFYIIMSPKRDSFR